MKTHYSISIPKPCHEDWSKMSPNEKGRFCQSCSKSVIDFTAMPKVAIENYLTLNSNKKVCGRFKVSQLEQIQIKIPRKILEQQTSFHKLFLLSLLIAMGTTLFNCSDKNGTTKKIDMIEVVDTLETEFIETVKIATTEVATDSTTCKIKERKPVKIKKNEPPTPVLTGLIIVDESTHNENINVNDVEPNLDELEDDIIIGFPVVEKVPEFKGTPKNLTNSEKKKYMSQKINEIISSNFNTKLGKQLKLKGKQRILVLFKIDKDGNVANIRARASHIQLEDEAKRVVNLLPKFIPGQQRGINIGVAYSLPIVFFVED
ncbi:energy transducer TonB [Winogradskyella litoriviva]|uniref:Energy transducer TonB n=1 Tax=Winogradskyella litoriviva TaxID=1220182 RepID=A0ABX2E779_9FLAO|nr:energy transducer TonB [Winogradskyella litoriviva]NRD24376.1 energy transducer TonB [Winogradskyella litoriviva]